MFTLCVHVCTYALNAVRHSTKFLKVSPVALWDLLRSRVSDAQTGPQHVRYHRVKKRVGFTYVHVWCVHAGERIRACLCWYVSTFPKCTGPVRLFFQQETHVLSWQGWGGWTELNSCTKETKRKLVCCCHPASEAQLGGNIAGQRGVHLFGARIAFKGPVLLMVSVWMHVCVCVFEVKPLSGSLCSHEQWAEWRANLCMRECWLAPRSWALCVCVCGRGYVCVWLLA